MSIMNTTATYGRVARWLHWLIAIAIMIMLAAGLIMTSLPKGPLRGDITNIHKLFGLLVLSLVVIRIVWRLINPTPTLPSSIPAWQRAGAHFSHLVLYLVMLAIPLSGWIMSTAAGKPPHFFQFFNIPMPWIPQSRALAGFASDTHTFLAWLIIAVIAVHILVALKHHFVNKDDVLKRML